MSWRDQPRDERGRWTKGAAGTALGAAVLTAGITMAGGGDAVTSVGAGLDAAAADSSAGADTSASRDSAEKGDRTEAWRKMALKEVGHEVWHQLRCGVQSTGRVQQFFLENPCQKLDQLAFAVQDGKGNVIAGFVSWVTMDSSGTATELKRLEDGYGSGDVVPFGMQALEFGGVHFTGRYYHARQDDKLVVIAETEPVRGHPAEAELKNVAAVADVLPPL